MQPFSYISAEDYRILLLHLLEIGHLQRIEDGGLIIGLEGEKLTNSYKFLAVFADGENEYVIVADSKPEGKIENPPPPGERVTLAGRTWEVTEVDSRRRLVFVVRVKGKVQTYWKGGGSKINDKILEKMKAVLFCKTEYPYLQKNAKARISEARFLCEYSGLAELNVVSLGGKTVCILPWAGTVDFITILYLLRKYMDDRLDARSVGGWTPYFITAKLTNGTVWDLLADFQALLNQPLNILEDITDEDAEELKGNLEYKPPKYDAFVPKELQKKAIIADYINLEKLAGRVAGWKCGTLAVGDTGYNGDKYE
jgi:ATP-dependent Lhr-like helicase